MIRHNIDMKSINSSAGKKKVIKNRKLVYCPIAAIIISIFFVIAFICYPLVSDSARKTAYEFLMRYYTIENTEIVDMFYDYPIASYIDGNIASGEEFIKVGNALKEKYGKLMTEKALDIASANRVILEGEFAAKKFGSTLMVEDIDLWDKKVLENNNVIYQFKVTALVKLREGIKKKVVLKGSLGMVNIEDVWKVNQFEPVKGELAKIMQFEY